MTDVILRAFQACAASQGDCNNLTFGFGGNLSGEEDTKGFGYYETIAGGSGAVSHHLCRTKSERYCALSADIVQGPDWHGASGVHTHMTNTRITDAEVFERRYPVILRTFSLRPFSGGSGLHPGGDGVIRDIEFRIPVQVSILSERRVFHPYGLAGGNDAACGMNIWMRKVKINRGSGEHEEERRINLGAKNTASMKPGERIIIYTPGGGGWGAEGGEKKSLARQGQKDPKHAWRGGSLASHIYTQETA